MAVSAALSSYRCWRLLPYPTGYGRSVESPDRKLEAGAMTMVDMGFFGGERRWYEFTVNAKSGYIFAAKRIVVDVPLDIEAVRWEREGAITWSADGRSVAFKWDGVQLTIGLPPP